MASHVLDMVTLQNNFSTPEMREGMMTENERDAMSWRGIWIGVPETVLYTSFQLRCAITIAEGLIVKKDRMLRNLAITGGQISSEHLMFALGAYTGKQTAHHIIYEAAMKAAETGGSFADILKADRRVTKFLKPKDIEACSTHPKIWVSP